MKKILMIVMVLCWSCGPVDMGEEPDCVEGVALAGEGVVVALERSAGDALITLSREVDLFWSGYDPDEVDPTVDPFTFEHESSQVIGQIMGVDGSVAFYLTDAGLDFELEDDVEWVVCGYP